MNLEDVLVRPLVTEKSTSQMNGADTYAFVVGLAANKIQIKEAIEALYGVKVAEVRTCIVRGKFKRSGRSFGKRSNWKKAYVQLVAGHSLSIYEH